MREDRELLDLAAKVAGVQPGDERLNWNPLADDGDALRLAVELRLVVDVGCEAVHVFKDGPGVTVPLGLDPGKAARRAIVRAAAEIGREQ